MAPEDYLGKLNLSWPVVLEKSNVSALLKEVTSLMLENRPENPILFLADQ